MTDDRPPCSVCGIRPRAWAAAWVASHCAPCSASYAHRFRALLAADAYPTEDEYAAWAATRRPREGLTMPDDKPAPFPTF